ncbi:MAG: hypothetical protein KAR79_02135 [Simkaniaceae bacterium]|nr:hypothetical protein [Simkaniaceae bacterium]
MIDANHGWNASLKPITLGFILSAILTFAAYRVTTHAHLSNAMLEYSLIGIGCITAVLQLVFFMFLGMESKPHWNLVMFLYIIFLVVALILGSIWIMANLDYNTMPDM